MIKSNYIPFVNQAQYLQYIHQQVSDALLEDIGTGDLTAALVPENELACATIIVREAAVICGIDWVNTCFKQIDPSIHIDWQVKEGEEVSVDQIICTIKGQARSLLTAERCALNFLQTLSGTATSTNVYVKAIAGTKAKVLDTRKTIPQLRLAQKYAVNIGGGANQRLALYDGILIKENHIAAAGSIRNALANAFTLQAQLAHPITIQIEVENLTQLQEALDAQATSILLDNYDPKTLIEAVKRNQMRQNPALLEASGGITLVNIREIALTGVDRISIGAMTKHLQSIDFSMRFLPKN